MPGSFLFDIYAITAVLAVGISLSLYGFLIQKQLLWSISSTCLAQWSFQMVTDLDRNILKII